MPNLVALKVRLHIVLVILMASFGLAACGGDSDSDNNAADKSVKVSTTTTNADANASVDQPPALTCDGLRNGEHDGFCGTIKGTELGYFTRLMFNYSPGGDKLSVTFTQPNGNAGSAQVGITLDAGNQLSCGSGKATVQVAGASIKGLPSRQLVANAGKGVEHTNCDMTISKQGRVITGTVSGDLGTFDYMSKDVAALTAGSFRITLPKAGENISATIGGKQHQVAGAVTLTSYRPGRGASIRVTDRSTNSAWLLVLKGLSADSGTINCGDNGSWTTYRDGSETPRKTYQSNENCSINYRIKDNLLTGTFSGKMQQYDTKKGPFNATSINMTNGSFKIYLPDGPAGTN